MTHTSTPTKRTPQNPFIYKYPKWSTYEKWKVALMCCTLIPLIRIILVFLVQAVITLICLLFSIGMPTPKKGEEVKPMEQWRRKIISVLYMGASRINLFILGFHWIEVKGRPLETARIFVCNHKCMFDPLVCNTQFISAGVTKVENLKVPLVGTELRLKQMICVDRTNKDSKRWVLNEIKRRAVNPDFPPLLVFPEGTTTNGEMLITFKPGAFSAKVPVQPVTLRYNSKNFDPGWVFSGPHMMELMFRTACQLNNSVTVSFCDMVIPTPEESENPRLFAERVRRVMADDLQVPVTSHSLEDSMLMSWGHVANVDINVKMHELRSKFKANMRELKAMLKVFQDADKSKSGKIGLTDFIEFFGLAECREIGESIFNALDKDESGYLDFKQFVVGLFLARSDKECTLREKIEFAFRVYDVDKTNSISRDEGVKIIRSVNLDTKPTKEEESRYIKAIFGDDGKKEVTLEKFTDYVSRRSDILQVIPSAMEEFAKSIKEATGSIGVLK